MNPTIRKTVIDRAIENDPSAARAEWFAEFREDLETFLASDVIERAVIPGRTELPMISGVTYSAFTDPSGGRNDSFTLGIAHLEGGTRVVVDCLKERRPPFAPIDVVREYADVLRSYGLSRVAGDGYSANWVSTAFSDNGIRYDPSGPSRSEIYLNVEPLFNQGRVELLDLPRLTSQLKALERRTRAGGRDQVDHGPGAHDDAANAAAGAIALAAGSRGSEEWGISWMDTTTGCVISSKTMKSPPEFDALNDEAFIVKYLAYIKRYEMIDRAARFLDVDAGLLKRWVQHERQHHDYIQATRAPEIQAIYESIG